MGYAIESADWPEVTQVPSPVKQLVERFYHLVDSPDPGVGDAFADQVFADDAVAYFGGHAFRGAEGGET